MADEVEVPAEAAEVTEETTPIEEPVEEATADETAIELPKKKTAQERIDEITRARRSAEREAEYWRKEALKKVEKPPEPIETPQSLARPTLSQFDTTEKYEDALLAWNDKVREQDTQKRTRESMYKAAMDQFRQRSAAMREQYDDYDVVIETPPLSDIARLAIANSENGPDVAYYLGTHHDVAQRINALPLEMQPYEIGKLEANLLIAKKTRKVTTAPPPINPVGATGTPEVDPSKMSTAEWMAWNKKKDMEKLKAKYG